MKKRSTISRCYFVLAVAAAAYDVWVLYENYFHPPVCDVARCSGFAGIYFSVSYEIASPLLGSPS